MRTIISLKSTFFKVLAMSVTLFFLLSSCTKKWTLETSDTKVVVGIDNNSSPCIYELSNSNYKWNWTSTPSVLQLPTKVVVRDGNTFDAVSWTFQGANEDMFNGKMITLSFACTQVPGLSIQSIWWAASS
jgi:hypothetical protein